VALDAADFARRYEGHGVVIKSLERHTEWVHQMVYWASWYEDIGLEEGASLRKSLSDARLKMVSATRLWLESP